MSRMLQSGAGHGGRRQHPCPGGTLGGGSNRSILRVTYARIELEDLEIKRKTYARPFPSERGTRAKINLHMGTCGIAAGAKKLDALISGTIEEKGLQDIKMIHSGCAGLCSREPMVTIESLGLPPVKYCDLNEEKVQEIFDRHVMKGEIVNLTP